MSHHTEKKQLVKTIFANFELPGRKLIDKYPLMETAFLETGGEAVSPCRWST